MERRCSGQEKLLPLPSAANFNLYEPEKIEVAPGDRIRVESGEIISPGALHIDKGRRQSSLVSL
jgi:hypothetical protein